MKDKQLLLLISYKMIMKKIIGFSCCLIFLFAMFGCGKKDSNLPEDKKAQQSHEQSVKETELYITDLYSESDKRIIIEFNKELDENNDLKAFVNLTPEMKYSVSQFSNTIIINGLFDVERDYTVEVKKNLKSKDGYILKENYKRESLAITDALPKVTFSNSGIVLPSVNNKKIAIKSINVQRVLINVKKVYENNVTSFLHTLSHNGDWETSWDFEETFENIGDVVHVKRYDIDYKKNRWTQSELDLSDLIDEKGIYVIKVSFNDDDSLVDLNSIENRWNYLEHASYSSKILLLSDMGLIAQRNGDELRASSMDLLKNTPLSGVKIASISKNNQILEELSTDKNGEAIFTLELDKIMYLAAYSKKDKALLRLNSELPINSFDIEGEKTLGKNKVFVYTERVVYRPGDKINISIIARDENGKFPKGQPISLSFVSPNIYRKINNLTLKTDIDGYYTHEIQTDLTDPTGIWTAIVDIGGSQHITYIPLESVVASKIKTDIDVPDKIDIKYTDLFKANITTKYLFGAPGSGLDGEINVKFRENIPKFTDYKNYAFKNPTDSFNPEMVKANFSLNEEGKAIIDINLPEKVFSNSLNLISQLALEVRDEDGRPNRSEKDVILNKFDSLIGIEEQSDNYVKIGEEVILNTIVVSSDGKKLIPNRNIKYKIYKNDREWYYDYYSREDYHRSIKISNNTKLIKEGTLISGNKPQPITVQSTENGELFVEIEDLNTGQTAGTFIQVSHWGSSFKNQNLQELKIQTDKASYNTGETAKIIFEGVPGAKALITFEHSGKVIKRYWKDIKTTSVEETIDLTPEMAPNLYVSVMLFQDYKNFTNDRPLRVYGVAPIIVKDDSNQLNIKVDLPNSIKPKEKLKVKVSNDKNIQMNYTVSVVDEGLHLLTKFANYNPFDYFYGKEAMNTQFYDNYGLIISKNLSRSHQLLKIGGGYDDTEDDSQYLLKQKAMQKESGLEDAQRFKPVSMFKGILTSDANGNGEIEFDIPAYMGSLKVTVVGVSDNKYGVKTEEVPVKAPLIVQHSAPRALQIGDAFDITVNMFALEEGIGNTSVTIELDGQKLTDSINFVDKSKNSLIFRFKAPNDVRTAKAKINVKSSKYQYEDEIDFNVNTSSPYVYIEDSKELKKGEKLNVNIIQDVVKGTDKASIVISSKKLLGIDNRIKGLIRYPYGCLEQVSSIGLAQLYIEDLSIDKTIKKEDIVKNINQTIENLKDFQTESGGFGYWKGNLDTSPWASIYAIDFLTRAKEKGYFVPEDMYENAKKWLKVSIRKTDIDYDGKAYALYVLALANNSEISEMNVLKENHFDSLTLTGKWLLASAYKLSGDNTTATNIAKKLGDIPQKNEEFYRYSYGSDLRNKAVILNSYKLIFGKTNQKLNDDILGYLKSSAWLSTQSTSWALLSLVEVELESDKKSKGTPLEFEIISDNKTNSFNTSELSYSENISSNTKNISVVNKGNTPIYAYYMWEGKPLNYDMKADNKGLVLTREFFDNNGKKIDPSLLNTGDSFWIQIGIRSESDLPLYLENVALTQILPSGWEIENRRYIKGDTSNIPNWIVPEHKNLISKDDYVDIRDDRIMWFFGLNNSSNKLNLHFLKINVVSKGSYTLPAAKVEAMYDNNYRANTSSGKIIVK